MIRAPRASGEGRPTAGPPAWSLGLPPAWSGAGVPRGLALECRHDGTQAASRDWFAARPVFYAVGDGVVHLAGTPLEAAQRARLDASPDPAFFAGFFSRRELDGNASPLAGVHELRPGETLEVAPTAWRVRRSPDPLQLWGTFRQPVDPRAWDAALRAAVHDAMGGGAPAVMLSGGLDSLLLLAYCRQSGGPPCRSFSFGFAGDPEADETAWIERTRRALGVEGATIDASDALPGSREDGFVTVDWPLANPFWPAIARVCEAAAEAGCRSLMNGAGGDELFAAPRYRLADLLRARRWRDLGTVLANPRPLGGSFAALAQLRTAARLALGRAPRPWTPPWLTPEARELLAPVPAAHGDHPRRDYLQLLQGSTAMAGSHLEARFAARFGLSRQEPLRDPRLLRLAVETPACDLLGPRGEKHVWQTLLRDRVPRALIAKPRTGLLGSVFRKGLFQVHRERLLAVLRDPAAQWDAFVDRDLLFRVIAEPGRFPSSLQAVVWLCWCFTVWRSKLP